MAKSHVCVPFLCELPVPLLTHFAVGLLVCFLFRGVFNKSGKEPFGMLGGQGCNTQVLWAVLDVLEPVVTVLGGVWQTGVASQWGCSASTER